MCDIVFASSGATANGLPLFGKNSDRQRNEAHLVERVPARHHSIGATLRCTYLTIPQVRRTEAVLLCRPYWIWGAEMGANAHGVVIGNEGVHAVEPPKHAPALTGMDLVRLALERSTGAAAAVEVIIALLEMHGQGGNCGHTEPAYYHNSFAIVDANHTFVLETVGRDWLVSELRGAVSLSNHYALDRAERASAGFKDLIANGSSIADQLADPARQHISGACERRLRARELLEQQLGALDALAIKRILRDHGPNASAWNAALGPGKVQTLCMHAKPIVPGSVTAGSMVSMVDGAASVHWVTATGSPCLSVFKPVTPLHDIPAHGTSPARQYEENALWWRHERMARRASICGLAELLDAFAPERDRLEAAFREKVGEAQQRGEATLEVVMADCWLEARDFELSWERRIEALPVDPKVLDAASRKMMACAGIPGIFVP